MGVKIEKTTISCGFLASVIGVEPTAFRLGGEPSILLRYTDKYENWCAIQKLVNAKNNTDFNTKHAFMSHQPRYIVAIRPENTIYGVFLWIMSSLRRRTLYPAELRKHRTLL